MFLVIPHAYIVTISFEIANGVFINIVVFCTLFMKFIQLEIQKISKEIDDDIKIKERIKEVVNLQNRGLEIADQVEKIISDYLFVLYAVLTFILCFLFFEVRMVRN
jgi:hypothetical protein